MTSAAAGAHYAGLASAKLAARVGKPMKLGANIYDVLAGDKPFEEAAADVIVDGAVMVGGTYLGAAAVTVAGEAATALLTSMAAGTMLTSAAAGTASVIGGTAVGGAVLGGVSTVVGGATAIISTAMSAPLLPVVGIATAVGFIGKWLKK